MTPLHRCILLILILLLILGNFSLGQNPKVKKDCSKASKSKDRKCHGYGKCLKLHDGTAWRCKCNLGRGGDFCQTADKQDCRLLQGAKANCSSPNGKCKLTPPKFVHRCKCGEKYTGKACESLIKSKKGKHLTTEAPKRGPCRSNPCFRDSFCEDQSDNAYKCRCKQTEPHLTTTGKLCETKLLKGDCRKHCKKGTCQDLDVDIFRSGVYVQKYISKQSVNLIKKYDDGQVCVCPLGMYGRKCTKKCPKSYFGLMCIEVCRNCKKLSCSKKTGICKKGCIHGYYGAQCRLVKVEEQKASLEARVKYLSKQTDKNSVRELVKIIKEMKKENERLQEINKKLAEENALQDYLLRGQAKTLLNDFEDPVERHVRERIARRAKGSVDSLAIVSVESVEELAVEKIRRKRQQIADLTLEVAFKISIPSEVLSEPGIEEDVISAVKISAVNFTTEIIPGLEMDASSVKVTKVVRFESEDGSVSTPVGLISGAVILLVFLLVALTLWSRRRRPTDNSRFGTRRCMASRRSVATSLMSTPRQCGPASRSPHVSVGKIAENRVPSNSDASKRPAA